MSRTDYFRLRRNIINNFTDRDISFLHKVQNIADKYNDAELPERIGAQVLGPMLLGYSSWLHSEAVSQNADMIAFLSREGKILMRAYEQLYDCSKIRTEYINVSRLSVFKSNTINANCWNELVEPFIGLLRGNPSVNDFLEILGLMERIPDDLRLVDVEDTDRLYEFIMDKGHEYFAGQNEMLKKYLHQKGISEGLIVVSDIGYAGTMQLMLAGFTPRAKYAGRYIAMRNRKHYVNERYLNLDRKGYWIDLADEGGKKSHMRDLTVSAFERLLLSDEGTTTGYYESGGIVEPVKLTESIRGSHIIMRTHEAALQYLHDALGSLDIDEASRITPDVFFLPYVNFGVYPSRETVEFYRHFSFINGVVEFTFIPNKSFMYYLFHPLQAYKELSLSSKIIWAKGLLRIPLPYYEFFRFILEHTKIEGSFSRRELKEKLTKERHS